MTFTIKEQDYSFFPATMNGMPVIGVSYTRNGESFAEWSAEAWVPVDAQEAAALLTNVGWNIVSSDDDFQEVAL